MLTRAGKQLVRTTLPAAQKALQAAQQGSQPVAPTGTRRLSAVANPAPPLITKEPARIELPKLPRMGDKAAAPAALGAPFLLKDGTSVTAYALSKSHELDVKKFYADMDIDTLSEVHGSYCGLRTGLLCSPDEAERAMVREFNETVAPTHGEAPGMVIGLRTADGKLIGLCNYRPVEGLPGVCRTFSLVIDSEYHGRNAAFMLKRIQYEQARAEGYALMRTDFDASQMKGVHSAAEENIGDYFVVKLAKKAADANGLAVDTSNLQSKATFSVKLIPGSA